MALVKSMYYLSNLERGRSFLDEHSTLHGSFYFISFSNVIIPFICASDLQMKLSHQRVIIRPFILLHLKNCILFPFQLICWRGHNNIRAKKEIKCRRNQLGETKKRCYKFVDNFFPRQSRRGKRKFSHSILKQLMRTMRSRLDAKVIYTKFLSSY